MCLPELPPMVMMHRIPASFITSEYLHYYQEFPVSGNPLMGKDQIGDGGRTTDPSVMLQSNRAIYLKAWPPPRTLKGCGYSPQSSYPL